MELLLQPVEVIEMDIKRMHCMIEKLSECAKSEMESGIENVDTCEMGKVVDMMKDLAEIGRARVGKECRSRWSPYH